MKYIETRELSWKIFVHILVCAYIISSPILISECLETEWNLSTAIKTLYPTIAVCVIYYLNYFILIPRYFTGRGWVLFVVFNAIVLMAITCLHEYIMAITREVNGHVPPSYHPKGEWHATAPPPQVRINFFLHHLIGNAFVVLIAILASLSMKWRAAERNIEKMQLASKEAELKYLKSQINPHFLLNTLNNVYALTEIDPQRARLMIEELSKMLRYILYENQNSRIKLSKEVDIIRTYINLMEIRLAKSVRVDFDYIKRSKKEADIAPFIFMSLTENAFKHVNTRTRHAFIQLRIIQTDTHIIMNCVNSCNQLKRNDDVGGLGLKQVTTQLEAYYPGRYKWVKGYNESTEHYVSRIEIRLT